MGKPSAKTETFYIADGIYQDFRLRNPDKKISPLRSLRLCGEIFFSQFLTSDLCPSAPIPNFLSSHLLIFPHFIYPISNELYHTVD